MKIAAFNGSPRKNRNTAAVLKYALEGAASKGSETELIHLSDYNFKGCISCLSCKMRGGKSYGKCAVKDDLTPLLNRVETFDGIILGSPVYIGATTSLTRAFLERLVYPYLVYDLDNPTLFPKKIQTGLIYTLGANESRVKAMGYDKSFEVTEMMMKSIFGAADSLYVYDTTLFDSPGKYVDNRFDPVEKARILAEEFPKDCKKAYDMGASIAARELL